MVSKKSKKLGIVAFLLLLAIVGVGVIGGLSPLEVTSSPVGYLVPAFGHAECVMTGTYSQVYDIPKEGHSWICGAGDFPVYTPECTYEIYPRVGGYVSKLTGSYANVCTDATNDATCTKASIDDTLHTFGYVAEVNMGGKLYTSADTLSSAFYDTGDAKLKISGDVYGLRVEGADGYVKYTYTGCSIANLKNNDMLQSDKNTVVGGILPFGKVINWIGGSTPLYDAKDVITFNGQLIYVVSAGYYYKITDQTINGLKVVDSSQIFTDDAIQCRPEESFCTDDAKLRADYSGEGKACGTLTGVSPDWYPKGDNVQVCNQACVNSKIALVNCKNIPICTPDKPILDSNYNCVAGGIPIISPLKGELPAWFVPAVILLLVGMFAVIVGYVAYNATKKKRW